LKRTLKITTKESTRKGFGVDDMDKAIGVASYITE
jgi:hypothetical protein